MNFLLTELGYFGPLIMIIVIIIISKSCEYKIILLFVVINELLNRLLKYIINQPRPEGCEYINTWDSHPPDSCGMPSGHAQQAAAAAVYIILYTKNPILAVCATAQTALTMYQRYNYKKHTTLQIIIGASIGMIMGILFYNIRKQTINYNIELS